MLDQLIASKGRVFFGTFFSTLSGYVNRMRGYYIAKHKLDGYEEGTQESYYFFPVSDEMLQYYQDETSCYLRFPFALDRRIEETK